MKLVPDLSITSAPHRARHGWHPGWLFRNGAQGAWYDPSDAGTLFQDAAGASPVTAPGQTVGLVLDKSRGLVRGPNIGSPAQAQFAGATEYAAYSAPQDYYEIARTQSGGGEVHFAVPVDRSVEIDIEVFQEGGGAGIVLRDGSSVLTSAGPGHGRTRRILRCPSGTLRINLPSFPLAARFRVYAIRTLAGNHATQPVTTRRPVYDLLGHAHRLHFDGIDDCLRFDLGFPALDGILMAYAGVIGTSGRIMNRSTSNTDLWASASGRWVASFANDTLDGDGYGVLLNTPHVGRYHITNDSAALRYNATQGPAVATQGKAAVLNDMALGARADGVAACEAGLSAIVILQGGLPPPHEGPTLQYLATSAGVSL
ncbi:hypothetical protein [Roseinatronobacter sp.]|uniref:hypothetical protein n=1 Tax=Roseinatronobacter sp. TaxID=1945755 RepID=UPI003F71CF4E